MQFLKSTLAVVTLLALAACSGAGMNLVPAGVSAGSPALSSAHRTRMDVVGGIGSLPPQASDTAVAADPNSGGAATSTTTTNATPPPYCVSQHFNC